MNHGQNTGGGENPNRATGNFKLNIDERDLATGNIDLPERRSQPPRPEYSVNKAYLTEKERRAERKAYFNGKGQHGICRALHSFAGFVFIIVHAICGHDHRHKRYCRKLKADQEKRDVKQNGKHHIIRMEEPEIADCK